MKRSARAGLVGLLSLVLALTGAATSPEAGFAQEDCETFCYEGTWDDYNMICLSYSPVDCTSCTVECPGGGGPPNQDILWT